MLKYKNRKNRPTRISPEAKGLASEKSMSLNELTDEESAKTATQTPQQEKPKSVKKAKLSFVEKIFKGLGYVKESKFEERYILRLEVEKNYVLKSEVDQSYIYLENIQKDYLSNSIISTLIGKLIDILDMGEDFAYLSLEDKFARIQQRVRGLKATVETSTELRNELDNLKKQKEDIENVKKNLEYDNANLKAYLVALEKDLADANARAERYFEKLIELNDQLKAAKSETDEIKKKRAEAEERANLAESKIKYAEDKAIAAEQAAQKAEADAQAAREELANSEVGKLKDIICDLTSQIEKSKRNHDDAQAAADRALEVANAKVSTLESIIEKKTSEIGGKDQQIATMTKEVEEARKLEVQLNTQVQNMESKIEQLKKQSEIDRTEIESKTTELAKAADSIKKQMEEISEKESTITNLEKERVDKSTEISMLNDDLRALEGEKLKLTEEKEAANAATKVKADFIKSERDHYAAKMMKIVNELCTVAKEDFIVSCDEKFDRQCKTLAEKVWRPLIDLKDELVVADKPEADTMNKLEKAWYEVIKAHLDEPSELTRIAQWYAYSLVPFMCDSERSEGIRVNRSKMKKIYALASELLSMVGIRFNLPILYVENLEDGSDYENVTGQRQLNIEYMCPTARNHKEKIDISDTESIIIDVVEVGYVDNKGNKKNSQIII